MRTDGLIRQNYQCGFGSLWLPLEWDSVPPETKELAILIDRFKYKKEGNTKRLVVPFGDLISHIKPSLHRIVPNTLPPKSAWSAFGSNSCPSVRQGQTILLALFALDRINPEWQLNRKLATRLTEEALAHDRSDARSPGTLTENVLGRAHLIAIYGR